MPETGAYRHGKRMRSPLHKLTVLRVCTCMGFSGSSSRSANSSTNGGVHMPSVMHLLKVSSANIGKLSKATSLCLRNARSSAEFKAHVYPLTLSLWNDITGHAVKDRPAAAFVAVCSRSTVQRSICSVETSCVACLSDGPVSWELSTQLSNNTDLASTRQFAQILLCSLGIPAASAAAL